MLEFGENKFQVYMNKEGQRKRRSIWEEEQKGIDVRLKGLMEEVVQGVEMEKLKCGERFFYFLKQKEFQYQYDLFEN